VVYAPFTILETTVAATGVGAPIAAGIHFLSGFASELVNHYISEAEKWPEGQSYVGCSSSNVDPETGDVVQSAVTGY